MLDPWFRQQYPLKHLKKWLYWPWADYRLLRDAQQVLFTCAEEQRLAKQSFWLYRAREAIVPLAAPEPPRHTDASAEAFLNAHPEIRHKRCLLFLGRIHPKKGCDLLIKAFAKVATQQPDLQLIMAGPDSIGWQDTLMSLANTLGVSDRILWTGLLQGNTKWAALRASEAIVLPSHQENFGLVLAESLACGRPALLSNQVNIWREISAQSAGLVEIDSVDGAERLLRRWLSLDISERAAMNVRARHCYEVSFSIDAMQRHLHAALAPLVIQRP
jgi:glycosyltransferase involved in cell wall biosynthesis